MSYRNKISPGPAAAQRTRFVCGGGGVVGGGKEGEGGRAGLIRATAMPQGPTAARQMGFAWGGGEREKGGWGGPSLGCGEASRPCCGLADEVCVGGGGRKEGGVGLLCATARPPGPTVARQTRRGLRGGEGGRREGEVGLLWAAARPSVP